MTNVTANSLYTFDELSINELVNINGGGWTTTMGIAYASIKVWNAAYEIGETIGETIYNLFNRGS